MEQFLTTQEAAQHANVTVSTIGRWCRLGYFGKFGNVGTGDGNGYKIPRTKFDEFLNSHKKWSKKIYTPKPEAKKEPAKADKKDIPVQSLRIAANNLRIAISFAEEELRKIEDLLKDEA